METETKWPPLSKGFFNMKLFEFQLKLHWRLFLGVQLTIFQHWIRKWVGADQATSHYLNSCWLDYWGMHASLGLNEFNIIQLWTYWCLCYDLMIVGVPVKKGWFHFCTICSWFRDLSIKRGPETGISPVVATSIYLRSWKIIGLITLITFVTVQNYAVPNHAFS